jgi:hypothetical protein
LENFSFTNNDAEDYATSENWQKILILCLMSGIGVTVSVAQWQSTELGFWRALD